MFLRCFLAQACQAILLGVVVPRAEDVVLVLFEEAELLAVLGLAALLVVAPVEVVAEGHSYGVVVR